eukprot:TRINITY_DN27_c0_g1_i2.p1 TRINITY_DN27_c0_g1~~TRINITY_DN27_c0_g1_i2.p1  ORF type:complete len:480 (+),score=202.03 TRINITY_DN27_c0_g1_i2:47-1486(+)
MRTVCALFAAVAVASAAVPADEVTQIPGFPVAPFKVYSGYLNVSGPFTLTGYSQLRIHYQLHMSQGATTDPVVTWHQGGPGGSSLYGGYTEMGYFQVSDKGYYVNPNSWNRRAHMLYLESPAGSSDPIGFSMCYEKGVLQRICSWDDKSQAEAYAHTLLAFYKAFPELKSNELYLSGESYAGQYLPNIATFILDNKVDLPLKGIAVGNGCWGGSENSVRCNGPHSLRNDVDLFYGKAMISKKLRDHIYEACAYDGGVPNPVTCPTSLVQMDEAVGSHNVYNVYDNCADASAWFKHSGKSMSWLKNYLRENAHDSSSVQYLKELGGGYDWSCGGMQQTKSFFSKSDVQAALHLEKPEQSRFSYHQSGPASMLLYPKLAQQIRVLIYNGDADACVPLQGNEEWTTDLAATGTIKEDKAWHPWKVSDSSPVPAGYATTYTVPSAPGLDFSFVTIRLAGHMVPTFQPEAAYAMFDRFLSKKSF